MHDQAKYEPLEASDFFDDRRASRHPVPGTVARGQLHDDAVLMTGKRGNTAVETVPIEIDLRTLERGRQRYDIYCSPCHDAVGNGRGVIVQRGYRPPPSLHIERLRQAPAGYHFDVMTNGFGAMPDYRAQISVQDRWAIVAYIRALQRSQLATIEDVPPSERGRLGLAPQASPDASEPKAKGSRRE